MPQRRPPRVISQPTPLRVVGVGENCRQGARRAEDLRVARCMTGRSRDEAGLLTRCRRSARCGGDRHRGNRGCQQRYVVVHPRSHDHVPFDMLGMNPGPAAIELPSATYRQLRDIGGYTHAINASFTAITKILRPTCQYRWGRCPFRMRAPRFADPYLADALMWAQALLPYPRGFHRCAGDSGCVTPVSSQARAVTLSGPG
jgi:hypothetical protein